eukprot:4737394-Pyramimonas_sp.AAC.1
MIQARVTAWDISLEGPAVEFKGDSLLIRSWLQGKLRCESRGYCKRTAAIIDFSFELAARFNLRLAALGRETWRHEFKEDNTRADELTHEAKSGRTFYITRCYLYPFETYLVSFAIRGGFDGWVDQQGSGCGFWLRIGLINTQCNQ